MNFLPLLHSTACERHGYRFILVFIAGIGFSGDLFPSDSAATVYMYRQSKGNTVNTVCRSIAFSAKEIVITYEDLPDMTSRAICGLDFRIKSWHFEDKETGYDVTAGRAGDTIRITGRKGKKTVQKTLAIDGSPWYQAMEFSLLSFLKSGAQECTFWMIRPTDMNVFKMAVRRDRVDTIQVKGRPETAMRVTLSPGGIPGKFWKVTYWYRTSDYSFLKSSMPQGIPGSSPIIIESIGIKRPER